MTQLPLSDEQLRRYLALLHDEETAEALLAPATHGAATALATAVRGEDVAVFSPGDLARSEQELFAQLDRAVPHCNARHQGVARRRARWIVAGIATAAGLFVLVPRLATVFDASPPSLVYELATPRAHRGVLTLPHGTQVTLAPESRVRYSVVQGAVSEVTLSGEAFFRVASNGSAPFTVYTGKVATRVLGTEFSVRQYAGEPEVQVIVVSGKVESGATRRVVLTPGMRGMLTDSIAVTAVVPDARSVVQWIDGRLVFTETPVLEMLRTLGRWHDYEFRLADSALATGRVTTVFVVGDSVRMMKTLRDLLDVRLERVGKVITLYPQRQAAYPRRMVGQHSDVATILQRR